MSQGSAWDKDKIIELLKPFLKRGYSIHKACKFLNFPHSTVFTWIQNDETLRKEFEIWQNEVNDKARKVLIDNIEQGDKETARWWLERKERNEFSTKTFVENERPIEFTPSDEAIQKFQKFFENKVKRQGIDTQTPGITGN